MGLQEQKDIQIILRLTFAEAYWLKCVMQNPINEDGNPALEDSRDSEMRHKFWDELNKYAM